MTTRTPRAARELIPIVAELQTRAKDIEREKESELELVDRRHRPSARNLLHYLALRQSDIRQLQNDLAALGLSSLGRSEAHTLDTLNHVRAALHRLAGETTEACPSDAPIGFDSGKGMLEDHAQLLLGRSAGKRNVRIMVTMPGSAADDPRLIHDLLVTGMDVMRINCAHDDATKWSAMIEHLRAAERKLGRSCKVYCDLAGPKLRTGRLAGAVRVVKLRPDRDLRGKTSAPLSVEIVGAGDAGDGSSSWALPILGVLPARLRVGDLLTFEDTRSKKRKITIVEAVDGRVRGELKKTAYLESGLPFQVLRNGEALTEGAFGAFPEVVDPIGLAVGERLVLSRADLPGRSARRDDDGVVIEPAHVHCTLDAVFSSVRPGERISFDDGKIGAVVRDCRADAIEVEIVHTPPGGAKLRAEKGINLPDTVFDIPALTPKDLVDLEFAARHADIVGLSFVRSAADVLLLETKLSDLGAPHVAIVLKIETKQAFENLPEILMTGLRSPPLGVMVARGDLAVEVGFDRLAEVQEEILWFCEAAHVPVIWATQVLEGLATRGSPSRAEVSDAVMSARAECVMLNKGPYIVDAVRFLSGILERMEAHQSKKTSMFRRLSVSQWAGNGHLPSPAAGDVGRGVSVSEV